MSSCRNIFDCNRPNIITGCCISISTIIIHRYCFPVSSSTFVLYGNICLRSIVNRKNYRTCYICSICINCVTSSASYIHCIINRISRVTSIYKPCAVSISTIASNTRCAITISNIKSAPFVISSHHINYDSPRMIISCCITIGSIIIHHDRCPIRCCTFVHYTHIRPRIVYHSKSNIYCV